MNCTPLTINSNMQYPFPLTPTPSAKYERETKGLINPKYSQYLQSITHKFMIT